MKILFITPYLPYPPNSGSAIRTFNIIKGLSKRHQITLLALVTRGDESKIPEMEKYCKAVKTVTIYPKEIPHSFLKRLYLIFLGLPNGVISFFLKEAVFLLEQTLHEEQFDIVQIELLSMSYCVNYIKNIPVILDEHNFESLRYLRGGQTEKLSLKHKIIRVADYLKLKRYEINISKRFDEVFHVSKVDVKHLKSYLPSIKTTEVPNGVDLFYFTPYYQNAEDERSLVFSGTMFYQPNIDAMLYFYNDIFSLIRKSFPDIKLYIVGHKPPQEILILAQDPNVTVTGFVEDARPYIAKGTVYICPIRIGSGTRLKLLDAMAMGKAIVSTSVGCEGLEIEHGRHILIADKPNEFSSEVGRLLNNKELRGKIGKAARSIVEKKYGWDHIVSIIEERYENIIKARRGLT